MTYEDKRIKNKEGYTLLHMILQRGHCDKSTMLFLSLHGESLGTRLVVNIKIDNSNDFMYAYSLITSFNNFVSHSMRAESVLYVSQQ